MSVDIDLDIKFPNLTALQSRLLEPKEIAIANCFFQTGKAEGREVGSTADMANSPKNKADGEKATVGP